MGRPPCCDKSNVNKGPWTAEEDAKLLECIARHGTGNWTSLPTKAGLKRCGKSCRLRWTNYLRPDLKHDRFTSQEEQLIVNLHAAIGSRWSLIAAQLPGRTDNDVKNHWNTRLRKKLCGMGIDPVTHRPISQILAEYAGNVGHSGGSEDQIAKARISCLSRDLRTAYAPTNTGTSNPHQQQDQNQYTLRPNPLKAPNDDASSGLTDIHSQNSFWDLLAQLHEIKTVASAYKQPEKNPMSNPLNLVESKSISAAGENSSDHLHIADNNSQFTWGEFILEPDDLVTPRPPPEQSWDFTAEFFSAPMGLSAYHSCQLPSQLQMPQNAVISTALTHENYTINSQMQASPSYSAGSCCSRNEVLGSATSDFSSSFDALLLNSEGSLFWEFPDLETLS
eukprot:PITA_00861